jgi:hypothetical protein
MDKVERIVHGRRVLAIILRSETKIDGVEFLTPKEFPLQMGVQSRKKGEIIAPHAHRQSKRFIRSTQEMLHIDYGRVQIDFYDSEKRKISSTVLKTGDTVLLVEGGHGINVLEDSKIIEVKQGPYKGVEGDKEKFE